MKRNRQQKQIRAFLAEQFGPEKGRALSAQQEREFAALLRTAGNKSFWRRQTLEQQILPCIALYKALEESGFAQAEAYRYAQTYMQEKVASGQRASMEKMERVPGFYALYSTGFCMVMRTIDLWESTQTRSKNAFTVTIRKCLWHTACAETGCAELCRLFCEADNVTYGGLRKIGFARTQTLGCGGTCCDFRFFRK